MIRVQTQPRILPLVLFLLLIPIESEAKRPRFRLPKKQPTKALQVIHEKYKEIDSKKEEYKKTDLPSAAGTSSEGTSAASYRREDGNIVMVEEGYYAEMGRESWTYYYDGHKPFFILLAETRYLYPITVSAEERKKLGAGEDKTAESRFYFTKGKLIRWLEGRKAIPPKSDKFREQAKMVQNKARAAYRNAVEAKPTPH